MNTRQSPCFCLFQLQWCYVPISIGKPCTGVQDVILEVSLFQVFNCTLYPLPSCTVTVCRTNLATREIVDSLVILTAYIHVRIVSHCHLAPPRPFSNTRCCLYFCLYHTLVTLLHCHTVTLYGLNRSRSGLLQIMIHVWPDLWYTGAERGDTGHRHGGRSKHHHLHTTVCSGSCMHVGDGSRRPAARKAVELPSLRNSNAVVAFFFQLLLVCYYEKSTALTRCRPS